MIPDGIVDVKALGEKDIHEALELFKS